jgi:CheY-like chemotaxis protein
MQMRSTPIDAFLFGRRILIVEDEYMIAMSLRDFFTRLGATVVGPVGSVALALEAIKSDPRIDVALLDFNLGGTLAYDVAESLLSQGIPFLFTSGYDAKLLKERYPRIKNVQKPYLMRDLERGLAAVLSADG